MEQTFTRIDRSPWGHVTGIDLGTTIRGALFHFFISRGQVWTPDEYGQFESRDITNMGLRSTFGIQPFGKNYSLRFEIVKTASEFSDFTSQWRISVSISASTVPRFYLPVPPIIKATGQV